MTSLWNLYKYAKTGVASKDMTSFDKLLALQLAGGGFPIESLTGVPPISFQSNGKPLISWSMLGNGEQTGTPSPQSIIMPTFCGVRTENLVDFEAWLIRENVPYTKDGNSYTITSLLNKLYSNPYYFSGTDVYVSISGVMTIPTGSNIRIYIVKRDGTTSGSVALGGNSDIKKTVNVLGAGIKFDYASLGTCTVDNLMLNLGSTILPYEPFGYKIPITCAGQSVPVYLGQTQTVRRVKKLVLTGGQGENWFSNTLPQSGIGFHINIRDMHKNERTNGYCTHFKAVSTPSGVTTDCITYGVSYGEAVTQTFMYISFSTATATALSISDVTTFKAWLAAQYANGTPVTVWYVLATPETAIVNEPLAKIGDYADELHSEDAGVSIPTAKGQNTLTVYADLQPSEMSITGHIKAI